MILLSSYAKISFITSIAVAQPSCLILRDAAAGQEVRIEAHGENGIRVRAVLLGGSFKDEPDMYNSERFKQISTRT